MTNLLLLLIASATPLLLAVLSELIVERAGLINLGLEGTLLSAAMAGTIALQSSGSLVYAALAAILAGMATCSLFGLLTIFFEADQIVTGTALNLIAIGVTSVIYRARLHAGLHFNVTRDFGDPIEQFLPENLQWIDPVIVFAWIVVPVSFSILLWHTSIGLRLRAAGEYPAALTSVGMSAAGLRWVALLIQGSLAGIAGAYLAINLSAGFAENMTAGRGYIALAIVILGRWSVKGAILGAALFGLTTVLQYHLQASTLGAPYQLMLALPYLLTLVVLAGFAGRVRQPAFLGRALPPGK